MKVRLRAPHFIFNRYWPRDAILDLPPEVALTPLMEGLDEAARAAISTTHKVIFGRYRDDGTLLDDPPIERPLWDPQPEPPIPSEGGPGR